MLLSWAQVANRIDELIRSDRYLTAKEVEHLDAYEKEQIARRIVNFYYGKSAEAPRPFEKRMRTISEAMPKKRCTNSLAMPSASMRSSE